MSKLEEFLISRVQNAQKRVAEDVFNGVVNRSPVWTGAFRSGFNLSKGAPDNENILSVISRDELSPETPLAPPIRQEINFLVSEITSLYVSNSIPYAGMVEVEGTKYSPPGAVVRATLSKYSS